MITSDGSVVERAADMGITYFDTARGYQSGNNERMVGAALKNKRKDIMLSTKTAAPHQRGSAGAISIPASRNWAPTIVDIWYLHAKTRPADVTDDLIEAQQIAKKAGKIRFAGVSTHSGQTELIPFLATQPEHRRDPDALQLHHGAGHERGDRPGGQGGQGNCGDEGHGRRVPHVRSPEA